ncbi:major facilitator superfamily domain-containing protein [Alternaria rosae]|uniref:major facilitator superfamily domain-containing protein n=1 Tax=Alternaria rosae TaxID=1187941 RepID=UPI001E8D4E16|nr:major facilitator superfamily domain-containing protein [Alternaria rosae]KAH6878173.1 major facilitator superfamily domain-containing protein [Alternaria rosae]
MSHSDVEEKHVVRDKAISQEDMSRPSSSIHNGIHQQDKTASDHEAGDKEAKIDARSTLTAESAIPPPPDGGLHAWLKVFGGFMIYINIWGFTLTYGAFQTYYRTTLLTSSTPSAISWIGTVQAWLLIVIGVLSGPLFDLGYFRSMLLVGNFLVVLGIMMLSLSTQYWQVFLSQGVCMGLGAGLLYIPSLAMVGVWFSKKRALAMGIVMSGIAVGGVIYIIMFDRLTRSAGFPWAIRAIGFVALAAALLSIPALLSGSAWLKHKRKRRALFDKSALHDRLFLIFTACSFSTFLGYIVPYFYIPTYARERLGSSESTALYMLVLSIAGSFFGRLVSGVAAHWFGAIVTWGLCAFASGLLALVWISIETEKTFIAFSILWGFFSAALVTVPSAAFANITPDLSRLGTRLGMSWSVSSIATLIGAPIAGALLKKTDGRTNFIGVQVWSGACLMVGTGWLVVLWTVTVKTQKKGWRV